MKQWLFLVAFAALLLVSCGGDAPLSSVDYVAQGNGICEQMLTDITDLEAEVPDDPSDDEIRDFSERAGRITGEAIDELVGLVPPTDFVGEHERLVALINIRGRALGRLAQGEDAFDAVDEATDQLETHLVAMWSGCRA